MNQRDHPAGTRILYRDAWWTRVLYESVVEEWSPSGLRAKLAGGWRDRLPVVEEVLAPSAAPAPETEGRK